MTTGQAIGLFVISIPFGVVGFYLVLIAKFYRLKFRKGPSHLRMQTGLAALLLGLFLLPLQLYFWNELPPYPSAVLVGFGGLYFSFHAYLLYKAMMSVN